MALGDVVVVARDGGVLRCEDGEGWELSGTQHEAMVLGEGQVVHDDH